MAAPAVAPSQIRPTTQAPDEKPSARNFVLNPVQA
jgi:hypothetical protein